MSDKQDKCEGSRGFEAVLEKLQGGVDGYRERVDKAFSDMGAEMAAGLGRECFVWLSLVAEHLGLGECGDTPRDTAMAMVDAIDALGAPNSRGSAWRRLLEASIQMEGAVLSLHAQGVDVDGLTKSAVREFSPAIKAARALKPLPNEDDHSIGVANTGEAEELRSGIEQILAEADASSEADTIARRLQALLDQTDARDSLAWLERDKAPGPHESTKGGTSDEPGGEKDSPLGSSSPQEGAGYLARYEGTGPLEVANLLRDLQDRVQEYANQFQHRTMGTVMHSWANEIDDLLRLLEDGVIHDEAPGSLAANALVQCAEELRDWLSEYAARRKEPHDQMDERGCTPSDVWSDGWEMARRWKEEGYRQRDRAPRSIGPSQDKGSSDG